MPCVSYVVTVYNKRPYLPYLLAGLAAQQGTFEREFIFVDDGSTDDSAACLEEQLRGWSASTVIRQRNQGPARALNRGLAVVTGDFVKPMDADDILLPGATARLLDAMLVSGQQLVFGDPGGYRVDAPGGPAAVLSAADASEGAVTLRADALRRTLRRAQTTPSAWLATAAVVTRAGGCDPGVFVQDYSIELRIARYTGFGHLAAPVFLAPDQAPGRLSEQEAQTLHDINLAICHFLQDQPDLPLSERRYALSRILARAWRWRRRHEPGLPLLSSEFRRVLAGRFGRFPRDAALIDAACSTFRRSHAIRLPVGDGGGRA